MIEKISQLSQYKKILSEFPRRMKFCFAYGSGAFKQKIDPSENMLDLIFVVRNPNQWHEENISRNPHHYAQPLKLLGPKVITNLQEFSGANVYYNTLVRTHEGRLIKYGVISEVSFVEDLFDWNVLYLAGRLHKPVQILVEPDENTQLKAALVQNLHSAVHAALLLLPEQFTEIDFYKTIANLSYNGDFRMIFGEDKDKVSNIVNPQLSLFREIYAPILKHFDNYVEIPQTEEAAIICQQDTRPIARVHHLNHLPRTPQVKLVRMWSQGPRTKDTEDCLRAIAHDPECSEILEKALREIVWKSSISQSLKGILTAGVVKSIKYSALKIMKMISSNNKRKSLPVSNKEPNKVETMIKSVTEKQEEPKEMQKRVEP